MTTPVSSCSNNGNIPEVEKTKKQEQTTQTEDVSIFATDDRSQDNKSSLAQQLEEVETWSPNSVVKVKPGKNKKTGKETGLYQIEIYADENQTEPMQKDQCFIFKTGKNEKKYKFKTGQGNSVDFVTNGNEVSVEVTNGNRRESLTVNKIHDEAFEFDGRIYNSLDEIAVALNQVDLPATQETDGEINASKQSQGTGDCSLLSVLNALSHSEYGREILDQCFVIDKDKNTITVNLPGFGTSFEYDLDASVDKSKNGIIEYYYSSGDAEAYFLERAMSDSLKMVKEGKIKLSDDAPAWCKKPRDILGGKLIQALEPQQVLYALTGLGDGSRTVVNKEKDKKGEVQVNSKDASNARKVLEECEKGETTMVVANLSKKGTAEGSPGAANNQYVKDSFGNKVLILKGHSYAVKEVNTKTNGEKVITIIDPYDSSQEIILNEDTFLKTFNVIDTVKIKGNNKHPKYYH